MKKIILIILITCFCILSFDAYVFAQKKRKRKRYIQQIINQPLNNQPVCNWVLDLQQIYVCTSTTQCKASNNYFGFALKAHCHDPGGGVNGCPPLYVKALFTTLDASTCSETVWNSGSCVLLHPDLPCGGNDGITYNFCFSPYPGLFGLPASGYFMVYIDVFSDPNCGGPRLSRNVVCAKITEPWPQNWDFEIVSKPCSP
jgi:hypothetical protein